MSSLTTLPFPLLYPLALILTIGSEWVIYWWLVYRQWEKRTPGFLLLAAMLINASTQPVATWLVHYQHWHMVLVEVLVWISEVLLLQMLLGERLSRTLLLAGAANMASILLGLVIFH